MQSRSKNFTTRLFIGCVSISLGMMPSGAFSESAGISLNSPTTVSFDRNNTFGWRFIPVTDIEITALGYSDASSLPSGTGSGLSQPHAVGIYRVSDQALVASNTVPAGTDVILEGNFRFVPLITPVRLVAGTTYLVAGFALSVTPDLALAATNWKMANGITYANGFGISQFLVSAHGNPPPILTYPALTQTAILPTFAANFKFSQIIPLLTLTSNAGTAVINVTNLSAGTTNLIEKSPDLANWTPVQTFVAADSTANFVLNSANGPTAFYRVRVLQ